MRSAVANLMLLLVLAAPLARAQDAIDRLDMKAHVAFDEQDYELAIQYWTTVIKLDPKDASAWFNRGVARTCSQQTDKAVADFTEAIRLKPDAEGYLERAGAYSGLGETGKAVADYSAAIRLSPADSDSYCARAGAYEKEGEWDKAIADYGKAIQLEAPNPDPFLCLRQGGDYCRKGDYQKAIADYTNALNEPSTDLYFTLSILDARAGAYSSARMYDKAIADYNRIMTSASTDAWLGFYEAAWLYATCPDAKFRDGAKAIEFAQKACDLTNWKDFSVITSLAAAEAESGKWNDAVKHQRLAMELARDAKPDRKTLDAMSAELDDYQQKKPYRDEKK